MAVCWAETQSEKFTMHDDWCGGLGADLPAAGYQPLEARGFGDFFKFFLKENNTF